jgi:VWFA-related protein
MLALALGSAAGLAAKAGRTATPQQQTPAQQPVPDAPVPQTLPRLNTITPVGAALPPAPVPQAPAADPNAPGTSLPSSPAQTTVADQDDGPPPAEHPTSSLVVNVNFVDVPFTVKDSKGHLVPGLTWRDVRVYENGLKQSPKLFTVDPYPLSVALVIDQSVTFDTMEKINDSLSALQGAFSPYDEIAVFTYNNGVTKQTGFTAAQSARLGVILDRSKGKGREPLMPLGGPLSSAGTINNRDIDPNFNHGSQNGIQLNPPKEYHTLNDAILAAGREVSGAEKGRRRVVYVISDGKEYGSQAKEKDVIKYLQTNKISVYATLVGDSSIPGLGFLDRVHLPLTMRDDVLPRYTAATGGECDPEFRSTGMEKSFAKLSEEVRTQYTIGYYTHESPFNEKFRKIEVRVLRPGLTVIAKEGYYPSASDSRPVPVTPSAAP